MKQSKTKQKNNIINFGLYVEICEITDKNKSIKAIEILS